MPERGVLLYCRPGFESDCQSEALTGKERGARVVAGSDTGFVFIRPESALHLDFGRLIFARSLVSPVYGPYSLGEVDRVGPILEGVAQGLRAVDSDMVSDLFLEHPDTEEGRRLGLLCKAIRGPLTTGLKKKKWLWHSGKGPRGALRLHIFFSDSKTAFVGFSDPANASPFPLGIPRLKLHPQAPSRSSLKLQEAFLHFFGQAEPCFPGRKLAVDLGAAPGGWTYELLRLGFEVVAVDRAKLSPSVRGKVTHVRANAFDYVPSKKVDWLFCDVIERPSLIIDLVTRWFLDERTRRALFNLKLPMKNRHAELVTYLEGLRAQLAETGEDARVRCKHLYHDRREVTVYVELG